MSHGAAMLTWVSNGSLPPAPIRVCVCVCVCVLACVTGSTEKKNCEKICETNLCVGVRDRQPSDSNE